MSIIGKKADHHKDKESKQIAYTLLSTFGRKEIEVEQIYRVEIGN